MSSLNVQTLNIQSAKTKQLEYFILAGQSQASRLTFVFHIKVYFC